ncbi:hypothetical protein FQB35_10655 [Crassaminicella thermophila]|uniref:Phage anti-repressor protein n=1 Tax=Crassaminicella thermophila TaxID=2599308 RepID=A0A5C0SFS1_CRATE|nr:ORF6C domain-containing protein [Crassaminicella thermophila]QEK12752.1 hypothetical protein FQB35_10655 [Crassaminicella thermophila]
MKKTVASLIKQDISENRLTPIEIALGVDDKGRTTAKKLYEFLELNPSNYSKWAKRNIENNEFAEENLDYWPFVLNDECGGQATKDYKLTASFAKKLCMTSKSPNGELARNYFVKIEDKLKQVALKPYQGLSKEIQAIFALDQRTMEIDNRITKLENNMPLFNIECKELQGIIRKKGIEVLGGYKSPAYCDNSLRGRVYADIQKQLKREFGVRRYEAIKRSQLETARKIVEEYRLPIVLADEIRLANSQMRIQESVI